MQPPPRPHVRIHRGGDLKPAALKTDCTIDHVGFEIDNRFVVGYGLDYQGYYRNLPYVAQAQDFN